MAFMQRLLVLACFVVWCAAGLSSANAQKDAKRDFVSGEIIVGFKTEADASKRPAELQRAAEDGNVILPSGARLSAVRVEQLDKKTVRLICQFSTEGHAWLVGKSALGVLKEYSAILQKDPGIDFAHPNWIVKINRPRIRTPVYLESVGLVSTKSTNATPGFGPNDVVFQRGLHWHYGEASTGMNAMAAWKAKATGDKSVVVAILDTGILPNHPDIAKSENLLRGFDFISQSFYERDDEPGRDADPTDTGDSCSPQGEGSTWHGTHVAGTIGAGHTGNNLGIAGINWAVSVLPVRVLGRCGSGTIDDLAAGIRWAAGLPVENVPPNDHKADIINLSLGINGACAPSDFGVLISAINEARQAGSTVVVAAGNESTNIKETTPAGCSGVISVAASDQRGHLAPYSNYGDVTIVAPGGDLTRDDDGDGVPDGIWSLVAPSDDRPLGVAAYEGTSMATPHVSGAIALAIAQDRSLKWNPDKITDLLRRAIVALPAGACTEPCGPGLLNVKAMLTTPPECPPNKVGPPVTKRYSLWGSILAPVVGWFDAAPFTALGLNRKPHDQGAVSTAGVGDRCAQ